MFIRLFSFISFKFNLERSANGKHSWIWARNKDFTLCFVLVDAVTSATWKCLLFVVVYFSVTVLFYTYNSFPFDEKCKNTFLNS